VNAVITLDTKLEPRQLLGELMAIELEFGRDRAAGIANGPRTLDLDILLFDDVRINEPGLGIPHPRLAERAFVLVPLCEIAPQALDPNSGKTVAQLLDGLIPNSEGEGDAVVRIQGDGWRSGKI
jgi:2-amino-4-hydroxy-6-hydroxymethyldihydropteridine diphosphokinase